MVFSDRVARVQRELARQGHDLLVVGPSADLRWLIGYHALALERLTLLLVPADGEPTLVTPRLETPRAVEQGADAHARIVDWGETDDPIALVAQLVGPVGSVAVQDRLWSTFTLALQGSLGAERWVPGSDVLTPLRIIKDAAEIDALHIAGGAIDRVHAQLPTWLRAGRTEREVGRDITEAILNEHDEVNFVIVAGGPNGASPHHDTGDRVLQTGDAVVVDIGGTKDGYCSDVTRNYVIGTPDPAYAELHAVLEASQRAALHAVRPGVTAEAIDAAARDLIVDAGYGPQFLHRTGHGIGVEEHEEPWIVGGNTLPVQPGMAFSIEPGIYVEGVHGARIEDIVVVTDDGVALCNHQPRTLVEVPQ
ncbi:MAG: Xaa-Pro aminopeptidase [Myxococcota bacterium]